MAVSADTERVYDERFDYASDHVLIADMESVDGKVRMTIIEGDQAAEVELSPTGARALRLFLTRYERRSS